MKTSLRYASLIAAFTATFFTVTGCQVLGNGPDSSNHPIAITTNGVGVHTAETLIHTPVNGENIAKLSPSNGTAGFSKTDIARAGTSFKATYSPLDADGRAQRATALITYDAVRNHSSRVTRRPGFAENVHVAGEYKGGTFDSQEETWKRGIGTPNNRIIRTNGYTGYAYNKSHLIGWSLGGDMETHNLVLGTRAQNVGVNSSKEPGGMAYGETLIRNALYQNPSLRVLYRVTPVYKRDELVPRGTLVQAYSTSDSGKTINFEVWVANTEPGLRINYADGSFSGGQTVDYGGYPYRHHSSARHYLHEK